jgi:iron complex transport system ATP-binding protein
MKKAVEIKNLSCSYGKHLVLDDMSFTVSRGDFFIIIGPNGSGKTTLMKAVSGLMKPKKGHMYILDHYLQTYSRRALAQIIALVPQDVPVNFPFTVTEFVLMGRTPYLGMLGVPQKKDMEIANQAISFTDVGHLANRKLDQLSGGERQRVFIARAICQEPEIILLDEPTASLDLAHQTKVMDLMEKLKQDRGVTVVMVSHDINLAAMYGDTLLLLKDGKIVDQGTPEEVLTFQMLEETYGCTLLVDESPLGKFPRITPVPGKFIKQ